MEGLFNPVYTSKYYWPKETWSKKSVWWTEIPLSAIEQFKEITIVCQIVPNGNDFYCLKVPAKFLIENLNKFHQRPGKISLYLSTEPKSFFLEERGNGHLSFGQFLVD